MKQDERSVVREAQTHARHDVLHGGRIRPAVFMLVQCNPQTGAPMAQPAAIGNVLEQPSDAEEAENWQDEWLASIRTEARRLNASAVALCLEAEAEVEAGTMVRMAVIYVEDGDGVEVLLAPIDRTGVGTRIAEFGALDEPDPCAAVGIAPLLS